MSLEVPVCLIALLLPLLGLLREARSLARAYVVTLSCLLGLAGLLAWQTTGSTWFLSGADPNTPPWVLQPGIPHAVPYSSQLPPQAYSSLPVLVVRVALLPVQIIHGLADTLRGYGDAVQPLLALPLTLALLLALASAIRGVPVAAGVARGFHRLALPLLTALMLGYAAHCFYTAGIEVRAQQALEQAVNVR
jgi:hypothetical protein